jgi:hypothetical protein
MWGFVLGLAAGVAGKMVYDLFKEDQLPTDFSNLNTGRMEAMLDETRSMVRDLRDEMRQAVSGEGTLQEKAGRAISAATETVKSGRRTDQGGSGTAATGGGQGEDLKLTSGAPGSSTEGSSTGSGTGTSSGGPGTGPTYGTAQTMS